MRKVRAEKSFKESEQVDVQKPVCEIAEVYRQQKHMYEQRSHTVADRIVSSSQPPMRPIFRGKAHAEVECRDKISVAIDGLGIIQPQYIGMESIEIERTEPSATKESYNYLGYPWEGRRRILQNTAEFRKILGKQR